MGIKGVQYGDQEIIRLIRNGSKSDTDKALKYLYRTHYNLARGYILKNSGNEEDAADTYQEAMVVLYDQITRCKFNNNSSLKTYLFGIVRNIWLKQLRKHPHKITQSIKVEDIDHIDRTEDTSDESIKLVRQQIDKLDKGCKELLVDYYYGNCSMKDIMIKFGLGSEQAAKNKKYRCMQTLIKFCMDSGIKV